MARPLRIEFEGAWYHVMNRGAQRRAIYQDDHQRRVFLDLLGDVLERFGIETHAYCLMSNHYHLLLHTPSANLSRAMRHLDGVYTQRFNRILRRDGPLFRGRYKAIVVDADAYLLQVSRYIHRNPLAAGLVKDLSDYRWSSYPTYVGKAEPEPWLKQEFTYEMLGGKSDRYRRHVELGNDQETSQFYGRANQSPILGDKPFRERVLRHFGGDARETPELRTIAPPPSAERIVHAVCQVCGVKRQAVVTGERGRLNVARQVAMYLCCRQGRMTLTEVARLFGLAHYGGVAASNRRLEAALSERSEMAGVVGEIVRIINDQT